MVSPDLRGRRSGVRGELAAWEHWWIRAKWRGNTGGQATGGTGVGDRDGLGIATQGRGDGTRGVGVARGKGERSRL